jgi:hypothetical protein
MIIFIRWVLFLTILGWRAARLYPRIALALLAALAICGGILAYNTNQNYQMYQRSIAAPAAVTCWITGTGDYSKTIRDEHCRSGYRLP